MLLTDFFADLLNLGLPHHRILILYLLLQLFHFLHLALGELFHLDSQLLVFPLKITPVPILNLLHLDRLLRLE